MAKSEIGNRTFKNARIIFRNFSGAASQYNPIGKRNFCIVVDKDDAIELANEGWNVRWLRPEEEGAEPVNGYLQVAVSYANVPPKVIMITGASYDEVNDTWIGGKKTMLGENEISVLDNSEIKNIDLTITPYHWEMKTKNGTDSGVKAYLSKMYVVLEEDELDSRYVDEPAMPFDM